MRINFTTYDVRRGSDTAHVGTERCDIMLLAHEDGPASHPYWYARILGLYHVNVRLLDVRNSDYQRMDFALVRWLGRDDIEGQSNSLTRLGWDEDNEYGFIDPTHILRACHVVPAFAHGKAAPRPAVRPDAREDYNYYYVMRYVLADFLAQLLRLF